MFDVFTEEIEVLLKDGIANLYWFKRDLHKSWLLSGVPKEIADKIYNLHGPEGQKLTKRQQMDHLYIELRGGDFNRRLEVSRSFGHKRGRSRFNSEVRGQVSERIFFSPANQSIPDSCLGSRFLFTSS